LNPLRIAVVGAGTMGSHHARVIADSPETELVAIVDPAETADAVAHRQHSRRVDTIEQLLAEDRPEAAIVAVPTSSHAEVATRLLEAGIPVLIEKPIAASTEEAEALAAVAAAGNVPLAVGHVERFNPAVRALRERLDHEELGRVFQVHTRRLSPFPIRIGDTGVAFDLATHDLDIMSMLGGKALRVSAEVDRRAHSSHEDLLAATLRFDSGIIGLLEVNWLTPTKVRQLSVTGERGMLVVDYLNQHLTLFENAHESESWQTLDIFDGVTEGNVIRFAINRVEPLRAQLDAFVRLVRGDQSDSVDAAAGINALRLALAVLESGSLGQTVTL